MLTFWRNRLRLNCSYLGCVWGGYILSLRNWWAAMIGCHLPSSSVALSDDDWYVHHDENNTRFFSINMSYRSFSPGDYTVRFTLESCVWAARRVNQVDLGRQRRSDAVRVWTTHATTHRPLADFLLLLLLSVDRIIPFDWKAPLDLLGWLACLIIF